MAKSELLIDLRALGILVCGILKGPGFFNGPFFHSSIMSATEMPDNVFFLILNCKTSIIQTIVFSFFNLSNNQRIVIKLRYKQTIVIHFSISDFTFR